MKKVKINLLAIIGMMVAVGTLAFTAPNEMTEELHWFEVDQNGDFGMYIGDEPTVDCTLTEEELELCAVGLNDQQVDETGPGDPTPTIPSPTSASEKRYKEDDPN